MKKLSHHNIRYILDEIKYKEWCFRVQDKGDGYLIQLSWIAEDAITGKLSTQKGRKWYISSHAIPQEVVRTAYKAVLAAEEHEVGENFKYKGSAIFNPHQDPEKLLFINKVYRDNE